jgi:hypothetical protein
MKGLRMGIGTLGIRALGIGLGDTDVGDMGDMDMGNGQYVRVRDMILYFLVLFSRSCVGYQSVVLMNLI